ncbi:hypothetical protein ASC77_05380 [Nocardioides sp. Root1257]|uniref:hypothetical protein n=1 Tax=unclassified Nocardioides TaxID=2615069 RepID=UPI0006F83622|nr:MULTISPECIES: hypothetical protein [unclassified Nocardioides]KQW53699.1 hypothetical protein ASC77_05380 [Nocardioides sp. Root1257]KRC56385.1 hypothetical protein ASE24_05380 [Nocardioides sp. Root224]
MAVDPCTEYGLALALEDFVPVLLAGAGTVVLGQYAGRVLPAVRVPALLAGALVFLGGLAKATWKLLVASEPCRNYPFLENLLFPCLAFGFAGIACALVGVWRRRQVPWWPFLVLPVVGGAAAIAVGDTWPLLIVAAVGAVFVGVLAIRLSLRDGDRLGALLFVVYIVGTLVLPPLAGRPNQSESLQWGEQGTNTIVQMSFLLGALRLLRRTPAVATEPDRSVGARA